ncbi:MAG TPA: type III-B CRISPR module-associated protein Cmr3 [Kofleriaceae bacterium]|nr:type III-B CRISPR module-associated protein Cmr3 [Kofleriaceae bacterium]
MRLTFSAVDTWFFRDATPFTKDASPQSGVISLFPPHPTTVAGATRAALALARGWDGRSRWGAALTAVLGDGSDDLGRLQITGPFLVRDGERLFALPQHVVGHPDADGRFVPGALLCPGEPVASDLGCVPLPVPDRSTRARPRMASDIWITTRGLHQILRGELPSADQQAHRRALWHREPRVGIAREINSRTTAEGALYSTQHIRPAPGVGLAIDVAGVPADWRLPPRSFVPLGGESRLALCESDPAPTPFTLPAYDAYAGVLLIALTPIFLDDAIVRGSVEWSGVRVVGACLDRPSRIGGWDSGERKPRPLRNALPAGSVLFCAIHDRARFDSQIHHGLVRIGAATASGFGLCAVGPIPHARTAQEAR